MSCNVKVINDKRKNILRNKVNAVKAYILLISKNKVLPLNQYPTTKLHALVWTKKTCWKYYLQKTKNKTLQPTFVFKQTIFTFQKVSATKDPYIICYALYMFPFSMLLFLYIPNLVGNGVLFIVLYRVRGCRQVRDGKPLNELLSLFQCVFDFPFPQQFFTDNRTNATLSASGVKIFPFHLLLYTKMHTDKKARKIAIYAATILLLSHYFTLSVIISMMICL